MTEGQGPQAGDVLGIPSHEAWELLRRSAVGRLAVVVDGVPDIFPVNHVVDRGTIVFRSAYGTKVVAAHAGPVAFEVDGHDAELGEAWSVVVHGRARTITDPDEAAEALQLPIHPWHQGRKPVVVRVVPDEVTGRRFVVSHGADTPPVT